MSAESNDAPPEIGLESAGASNLGASGLGGAAGDLIEFAPRFPRGARFPVPGRTATRAKPGYARADPRLSVIREP